VGKKKEKRARFVLQKRFPPMVEIQGGKGIKVVSSSEKEGLKAPTKRGKGGWGGTLKSKKRDTIFTPLERSPLTTNTMKDPNSGGEKKQKKDVVCKEGRE